MYKKIIEIEINDNRYEAEISLPEGVDLVNRNLDNYKVVIEDADFNLIDYFANIHNKFNNENPSSIKIDCKVFFKHQFIGVLQGTFAKLVDGDFQHIILTSDKFEREAYKLMEGTKALNGTKIYKIEE